MSIDLSLDRLRSFLPHLSPPYSRPTIHIAGTNGKGSVSAAVSSILLSATPPFRVGRYNSPHLTKVTDCITIDNEPVDDDTYRQSRAAIEALARRHQIQLSLFEILTMTALLIFERAKVDFAVVEVGMGGRLDATNIIPTECIVASALATVDLDHQQFLGSTIEEVAREKLGIARPGKPFILGRQRHPEVEPLARTVLQHVGSILRPPVDVSTRDWDSTVDGPSPTPVSLLKTEGGNFPHPSPQPIRFSLDFLGLDPILTTYPLLGTHQLSNLATALGIIDAIVTSAPHPILHGRLTPEGIRRGVAQIVWRGRLSWQSLDFNFGQDPRIIHPILVDGAHNPGSSQALANYIHQVVRNLSGGPDSGKPTVHIHYLLAMSHSPTKSPRETLAPLLVGLPSNVVQVHVALPRFTVPEGMPWVKPVPTNAIRQAVYDLATPKRVWTPVEEGDLGEANSDLEAALQWVSAGMESHPNLHHLVVLAGSLYLVADFYRLAESVP